VHVIVCSGGPPPDPGVLTGLADADLVVAADRGLDHALVLGLDVHVVVGDLDSLSSDALDQAAARGVEVVRHPADKDELDLELALALAVERGASSITVVGGSGGRLDMTLANVMVLGAAALSGVTVSAHIENSRITVVDADRPATIEGTPGSMVSLLVVGAPAEGVCTSGLAWELQDATLYATSGRSLGNTLVTGLATVSVTRGTLLTVVESAAG
jgi:thiamine pyrophosphokinase